MVEREPKTNVLYCDDNLARLAKLPGDSVDLIYLDPPFFSNRTYEVIWGDEAEVRSFEDRWEGGIQHYIGWMLRKQAKRRRGLDLEDGDRRAVIGTLAMLQHGAQFGIIDENAAAGLAEAKTLVDPYQIRRGEDVNA